MAESEPARIVVRVQPNARQNQVTGCKDNVWQVRIAAPPEEGKANRVLIKFLSKKLGVSTSKLTIEKGATSRTKSITIDGLSQLQAVERLEEG